MVFENVCVLVVLTKVASTLERLTIGWINDPCTYKAMYSTLALVASSMWTVNEIVIHTVNHLNMA